MMTVVSREIAGTAATDEIRFQVPTGTGDRVLLYRVTGTFVGTLQVQDNAGGATEHDYTARDTVEVLATGTVSAADPTEPGLYAAALVTGANRAKIVATSWTSGTARVEAAFIPVVA